MKAIRTIVATAVIVFALTTVAMAGVQRFGDGEDGGGAHAKPVAKPDTATPASGTVTLSARQFAALLHAVTGEGARDHTRTTRHERAAARTHKQDKTRSHAGTHEATRPSRSTRGTSSSGGETNHATQHATSQHTTTQHTTTQTHAGGTHGGGGHDGGCD
jgi:hypothetical protein